MGKVFSFLIFVQVISLQLPAQQTASSSVSATIISPVITEQAAKMEFGKFSTTGKAGEVKLSTEGLQIIKGNVKLESHLNNTAAIFKVSDINCSVFCITLSYDPVVINYKDSQETMAIDLFQIDMTPVNNHSTGQLSTIAIGAHLKFAEAQSPGTYFANEPYFVTVNYN